MRKTLYLKLIFAYVLFAFFSFLVVAIFVSNMTYNHIKKNKADALYKEANLVANTYATDLYNNEASLDSVQTQLSALETYLDATVWIINPSGRILLDSSAPLDVDSIIMIDGFTPTVTADSYYTEGKFLG